MLYSYTLQQVLQHACNITSIQYIYNINVLLRFGCLFDDETTILRRAAMLRLANRVTSSVCMSDLPAAPAFLNSRLFLTHFSSSPIPTSNQSHSKNKRLMTDPSKMLNTSKLWMYGGWMFNLAFNGKDSINLDY